MANTIYEQVGKHLDTKLHDPLRQRLIGRQLFAKTTVLKEGEYNYDFYKVREMGYAEVSYKWPSSDIERDLVGIDTTTEKVPFIHKGYEIDRGQFNAFVKDGKDIDTAAMMSAAQVIGLQEDDILLQGWKPDGTNYEVNGLYQGAGTTETTSAVFSTFGNPTTKVALAMKALADVNVTNQNYNLILNPQNFYELNKSRSANGVLEKPDVLEMLNPNPGAPKGQIFQSVDITVDTGLMSPVDPAGLYMELVIALDMQNHLGYDSKMGEKISPVYGTVIEGLRPKIIQSTAIVGLTGL